MTDRISLRRVFRPTLASAAAPANAVGLAVARRPEFPRTTHARRRPHLALLLPRLARPGPQVWISCRNRTPRSAALRQQAPTHERPNRTARAEPTERIIPRRRTRRRGERASRCLRAVPGW